MNIRRARIGQSILRLYSSHSAAVYVHWPYCEKRCTYCNFNKYISRNIPQNRMRECLLKETETLVKLSGIQRVTSIFFGGGTPTLAHPETIAAVIAKIKNVADVPDNIEITMEGNPTSLEKQSLRNFKDAGVNRLSLGIQALNENDLKILGRNHCVEEAIKCVHEAHQLFPGQTSIDIIFGRPCQTLQNWSDELQHILKLVDGHVSLYQLTLERGTYLFKFVEKNPSVMPSDDVMADMYSEAVQVLKSSNLDRYEVSNFAVKGAESKHNMSYWKLDEYIGIGPGAHGRFCERLNAETSRSARIQTLEPENWMFEVEARGHATRKKVQLSNLDLLQELIAVGLRLKSGICEDTWNKFSMGHSLTDVFGCSSILKKYEDLKLLILDTDEMVLKASEKGLNVLDSMLPELILHINCYYKPEE